MSKATLDTPVYLAFKPGKTKVSDNELNAMKWAEIGIELELEGVSPMDTNMRYWTPHHEPSLKDNGLELVLSSPINMDVLPEALADVRQILSKQTHLKKHSLRTSTHIHINMQTQTLRTCYSVLAAWYLIEDALIRTQGKARDGNLFCLALSRAEGILDLLVEDINAGSYLSASSNIQYRYAACNYTALRKFGSLEWRFLAGMTDMHEVESWTRLFYGFVKKAQKYSWDEIRELSKADGVDVFKALLPAKFVNELVAEFGESYIEEVSKTNVDAIHILFKELERSEARYSKDYWGEEDDLRYVPQKQAKVPAEVYVDEDGGFHEPSAEANMQFTQYAGVAAHMQGIQLNLAPGSNNPAPDWLADVTSPVSPQPFEHDDLEEFISHGEEL